MKNLLLSRWGTVGFSDVGVIIFAVNVQPLRDHRQVCLNKMYGNVAAGIQQSCQRYFWGGWSSEVPESEDTVARSHSWFGNTHVSTQVYRGVRVLILAISITATTMYEQLITSLLKLVFFTFSTQDLEKQREEIERLRALLIQHHIPLESKQSRWTYFCCTTQQPFPLQPFLYVTDVSKSTGSTTVGDQHLRGDNGLLHHLWTSPGLLLPCLKWGDFTRCLPSMLAGPKKMYLNLFWI